MLAGGIIRRASPTRRPGTALAKDPGVLLLDEPTSGLDHDNTSIFAHALETWLEPGKIAIISSHDPRIVGTANEIFELDSQLPA